MQGGLKWEQGAEPPLPKLTLSTERSISYVSPRRQRVSERHISSVSCQTTDRTVIAPEGRQRGEGGIGRGARGKMRRVGGWNVHGAGVS